MFQGIGGDYPYAEGIGVIGPVIGGGSTYFAQNEVLLYSGAFGITPISAKYDVIVLISSSGQGAPTIVAVQLYDGAVSSQATATGVADATRLLQALIESLATAGSLDYLLEQPHEVWAFNTVTGASTRYEGYDFTSYAKVNGRYFGVKKDGLYALDGAADVMAHLHLGIMSFGSLSKKRVEQCYVGVASTGRLFLRVTTEGNSYTYAARSLDEHAKTQRIDCGKGLKAVYYEFELYNSEGGSFELSTVQFSVVELSRRI